jgi:hypothetical protein
VPGIAPPVKQSIVAAPRKERRPIGDLERITARPNPVYEQPFRAQAGYGPSVPWRLRMPL